MIKNDIIGELMNIIGNEDVLKEGLKDLLSDEQFFVLRKLKNSEFQVEDRLVAYKQGINMAEIGEFTNYTRAAISKYLKRLMGNDKEKIEEEFYANREKLYYARNWYFYVYKSDVEGDYRQIKQYLSSTVQEDSIAYTYYRDYGGTKLEKSHEDRRRTLGEDKQERILKKLKNEPMEKVAFRERLKLESIKQLAEENGVEYFYEEEIGETEYRDKLDKWLKSKEKLREIELEKLKEERRKKRENKEQ